MRRVFVDLVAHSIGNKIEAEYLVTDYIPREREKKKKKKRKREKEREVSVFFPHSFTRNYLVASE